MSLTTMHGSITDRVQKLFCSGRPVWWIVGDETARFVRQIKEGVQTLSQQLHKPIRVVNHDRWSGFRVGLPEIPKCKDKSDVLANAIQAAVMTKEQIAEHFPEFKLDWDPAEDIIFVFEAVAEEIKAQQLTVTLIRNICQACITSPAYVTDKFEDGAGTRGRRMLVFISVDADFPASIPELKPEIAPLPDFATLKQIASDSFKATDGLKQPTPEQLERVTNALCGMNAQDAEEALSLALVVHNGLEPFDDFLESIEEDKVRIFAKIPGLRYIPKSEIVEKALPGFEALTDFIDSRMAISTELATKHHITALRGLALGGPPGGGKTEIAKYIARRLGRVGFQWNMGESKGGTVGSSELACRQVIQAARATRGHVLLDDMDKGSLSGSSKNYGGDGGTSGNMTQMLLTEMSDPTSTAVYTFTFNRVPDMPELLRPGRVDARFYVERPNGRTRLAILHNHIERMGMTVDDEEALREIAYTHCKDWMGAELAHVLIKDEAIKVIAAGGSVLNAQRMKAVAKAFTPMIKQRTFREDIASMEDACSQFTRIGCLPEDMEPVAPNHTGKAARAVQV